MESEENDIFSWRRHDCIAVAAEYLDDSILSILLILNALE